MAPARRVVSRPIRSSRTQVKSYYEEGSSEDALSDSSEWDQDGVSIPLRPQRRKRAPTSYRDPSTDEGLEDGNDQSSDDSEAVESAFSSPSFRLKYVQSSVKDGTHQAGIHSSKPSASPAAKRSPAKKRKISTGLLNEHKGLEEEDTKIHSGIIPPWQTLPYHILFDVLAHASTPQEGERYATPIAAAPWLVGMARLCRSFLEPAMAVLYSNPPLVAPSKARLFLQLLSQPQEHLSTNYVNKVKHLQIDVEALLLPKIGPSLGYFQLCSLIERTPRIKTVRLYHQENCRLGLLAEQPRRSKWTYPDSLIETLTRCQIRLRAWEWNARFLDPEHLVPLSLSCHREVAFASLQDLALYHIGSEKPASDDEEEGPGMREMMLAAALSELTELRRLEFVACSIVNDSLLPNLPSTLTSLSIMNCDEVMTSNLAPFLETHGQQMRELILKHNHHLNLSFTVGLAQSCPHLEKLQVNICIHWCQPYSRSKELLGRFEVPTWPKTLQEIEMSHLRNWDDTQASNFFGSLINSAVELKDLRRLVISAALQIGWRDRASFREEWIGKLERVFLRRSKPPQRTYTLSRPCPFPQDPTMFQPESFKSNRYNELVHSPTDNSGPSTPSKRKSARIAQQRISESEDAGEGAATGLSWSDTKLDAAIIEDHVISAAGLQGMCDVVLVRIDNLRPSDTQFNESDFLGDELSGDEDWIGPGGRHS